MVEHTFVLTGDFLTDDAHATERVSDLIERLTLEVSRAGHSWRRIHRLAQDLCALSGLMTALLPAPRAQD